MSGSFVEVETTNGRVRGIRYRGVAEFLGIPYGASTAEARRFAPPVAPEKWSGVRDTMSFGDAAPQLDARLSDSGRMLDVRPHMYPKGGHPLDGVRTSENCLVLNVWSPGVGEEIKRPVMVWLHGGGFTAGSGGSVLYHGDQLAARGEVEVDRKGHVKVASDLTLPGHPNIFVIGDTATLNQNGKPLPGVAQVALQQGEYAAAVIAARVAGKEHQRPFHYRNKGTLATVGRSYAIADLGLIRFAGFPAWLIWVAVHLLFLIGFRNRYMTLFEWAWSYLTFELGACLVSHEDEEALRSRATRVG
jgi:Carboxylesterase family